MKTIYFMTVLLAIAFVAVRGARIARDAEEEEKKEPTLAEKLAEEASQLVKELEELHQKLISSGDRVSALQVGSAEHRLAAILDKVDWLILLQPDNVPSKFTTALQNAINAAKNTIAENSVAATEAATEAVVEVETVAPVEVVPVVTEAPARKFRSVHARIARDAEEEEKKEPTLAEQLAEEASQLVKELDELRHKLIASGDRASAREVSEAQDRLEQKLDNSSLAEEDLAPFLAEVGTDDMKKRVNDSFTKFDKDGSGYIELGELSAAVNELVANKTELFGSATVSTNILTEILKEFDTNQDGKLDRNEFYDLTLSLLLATYELKFD